MRRTKPVIVMTDVADGAILLDEAKGTFYHLNPTGALVYRLLRSSECTIAEAAETLASAFGLDEAATLANVEAFFDELARKGLVPR
jgi:hypothetical protein